MGQCEYSTKWLYKRFPLTNSEVHIILLYEYVHNTFTAKIDDNDAAQHRPRYVYGGPLMARCFDILYLLFQAHHLLTATNLRRPESFSVAIQDTFDLRAVTPSPKSTNQNSHVSEAARGMILLTSHYSYVRRY